MVASSHSEYSGVVMRNAWLVSNVPKKVSQIKVLVWKLPPVGNSHAGTAECRVDGCWRCRNYGVAGSWLPSLGDGHWCRCCRGIGDSTMTREL